MKVFGTKEVRRVNRLYFSKYFKSLLSTWERLSNTQLSIRVEGKTQYC